MTIEYISVFFSTFGIMMSIVHNELSMASEIDEDQEYVLLCFIMTCSIALSLSIFIRYEVLMQWNVNMGLLTEFDTLISTRWW